MWRRAGATTIDFGAGTGTFAERLAGHSDLTCVEYDEHLRQHLQSKGLAVTADAADLAPASIDYVYSLNVLEHDDHAAIARTWYRLLKPGGHLLVYVLALQLLYGPLDRKVGHLHRYRRSDLHDVLEGAGFVIEELAYADALGFPASLAAKYVGRKDGGLNPRIIRLYDRYAFPVSLHIDRVCSRAFGKNVWAVAHKSPLLRLGGDCRQLMNARDGRSRSAALSGWHWPASRKADTLGRYSSPISFVRGCRPFALSG